MGPDDLFHTSNWHIIFSFSLPSPQPRIPQLRHFHGPTREMWERKMIRRTVLASILAFQSKAGRIPGLGESCWRPSIPLDDPWLGFCFTVSPIRICSPSGILVWFPISTVCYGFVNISSVETPICLHNHSLITREICFRVLAIKVHRRIISAHYQDPTWNKFIH